MIYSKLLDRATMLKVETKSKINNFSAHMTSKYHSRSQQSVTIELPIQIYTIN